MASKILLYIFLIFPHFLSAIPSPQKLQALYNSLDPRSVAQHVAFYELYSSSPEGKKALDHAWNLMSPKSMSGNRHIGDLSLNPSMISALVSLITKQPYEDLSELSDQELASMQMLASHLPNRKLKGFYANSETLVLQLPPDEIDLARGLFLSQLGENEMKKIRTYEAVIDLMAMQILAKLHTNASPKAKIRAINDFIFGEMGFRFPPHSLYAKDIDVYTFLPSVLDSRRGVCLGVSILYICIAQRLDLPLEMITPPGHIYVRYRQGNDLVNIETTARGVHVKSDHYLGIETRSLQTRTIKDVIGLAHFNQASVFWHNGEYEKALRSYQKAEPYIPDDKLLTELMGYTCLFANLEEEGKYLLETVKDHIPDYAIVKQTIAEDYLNGRVNKEGIQAIFTSVDETHDSIAAKRKELLDILVDYPLFRAGWFHLAITWLQQHRTKEALEALQYYHKLNPNDPTAEYYLAVLYAQRLDYNQSWQHLRNAEGIVQTRDHSPKALKQARTELSTISPE